MCNQRGDTKFASSIMCSVRAGASCKAQQKDLMITGKWVVIKGNCDLISTNSSQCARRITLPVCTIELSVRSLKSCLKYHLRGKKEGRKKSRKKPHKEIQRTATSKAESWQVIKPRAHPLLENCGLYWHWKGKIELERVQRRGIPKAETNSPGSFGRERDSWWKRRQTSSQL